MGCPLQREPRRRYIPAGVTRPIGGRRWQLASRKTPAIAATILLGAWSLSGCGEDAGTVDAAVTDGGTADAGSADGGAVVDGGTDGGDEGDAAASDGGVVLVPLGDVVAIATGLQHGCALRSDGSVFCWGANQSGQLGDGTVDGRAYAEPVTGLDQAATSITAGGWHTCVTLADGQSACWGENRFGQLGTGNRDASTVPLSRGRDRVAIAAGTHHTCTLLSNGRVFCWGDNGFGQLGDGTVTTQDSAVRAIGLGGVGSLGVGDSHSCAARDDGSVACWGFNGRGQLGTGDRLGQLTATDVADVTDATEVVAGDNHSCARHAAGTISCWGLNARGQVGPDAPVIANAPVPLAEVGDVIDFTAGGDHTCVVVASPGDGDSGAVSCFGANGRGQLGDGTNEDRATPAVVPALIARSVVASRDFTCALTDDGQVACWGENRLGQLGGGDGAEMGLIPSPVVRTSR